MEVCVWIEPTLFCVSVWEVTRARSVRQSWMNACPRPVSTAAPVRTMLEPLDADVKLAGQVRDHSEFWAGV